MVEIIWAFVVKDEARGQFELLYGPGGAWSCLFDRCSGFRGLTVLRDVKSPQRYLTIEVWDTEGQRHQSLDDKQDEYSDLKAILVEWVDTQSEVGIFNVLGSGGVYPRSKAGRRD